MFGDYSTAHAAIVTRLNGRTRRTVGTATVITLDDDNIARVTYRGTHVLTAMADGSVMLDTGGWPSQTTMRRMNDYLPAPWRVNGSTLRAGVLPRTAREWTVTQHHPSWGDSVRPCVPFLDTGEDGPDVHTRFNTYYDVSPLTGNSGWGSNDGHARQVAVLNTRTGESLYDAQAVSA